MRGRLTAGDVARNLTLVLLGNVVGAVFVAFSFAVQTGVIGGPGRLAGVPRGVARPGRRLGVRKIPAVFFPIMAFVATGVDHLVANVFVPPAAIFAGTPGLGWDDTLSNWLFAGLATSAARWCSSYWYPLLKDRPAP